VYLYHAEEVRGLKNFPPPLTRYSCSFWVWTNKQVKYLGKLLINITVVTDFIFLRFWKAARAPPFFKARVKIRDGFRERSLQTQAY